VDLYSAFRVAPRAQGAQLWITVLPANYLPLPRKRSPDGATTDCSVRHLIAAYYSFVDPERMKS